MRLSVERRAGFFYGLHQAVRVFMALLMLVFQFAPLAVRANPQGEQVVAGSASFNRGGNTLTIHTSDRVIINWQDFSIQSGELTKFVQPSASSSALNRVVSGNPSAIYGTLQANGQIFLINPNGILVGGGAVIDTGGFIASTFDVANDQFLAGGQMNFMGGSTAGIDNQGTINAIGGDIILIAREINNSGTLSAPGGTVGLAAGHDVLFTQSGHERVFIRPTVANGPGSGQGILNSGVVDAARVELKAHGNLYALAINNTGVVRAQGATVGEDGRVFLTANGGAVKVGGTIEARGLGGSGGMVTVSAERVEIDEATIDVSGENGGGSVNIGGGFQGKDPTIENSQSTTVSAGSVINADATVQGDGGDVVIWSDGTTKFNGAISARGAGEGGDGGFAEVSGAQMLEYRGLADLRAEQGETGMLLLDPKNIAIVSGGVDPIAGNTLFTDNPGSWALLDNVAVSAQLNLADLTLQANTDIFIASNLVGANDFTLQAGRSITIEQGMQVYLVNSKFSATINDSAADGANRDAGVAVFSMESGSEILTNGGDITITHGNQDGTGAGEVRIGIGTANDGAASIDSVGGQIDITGTGSASGVGYGISIGNGSSIVGPNGAGAIHLTGAGDGNSPGIYSTGGSNEIGGAASNGAITLEAGTATGTDAIDLNNLTITGTGSVYLKPNAAGTDIGVAGGAGTFNLSATELDQIADGHVDIVIGRFDGTGTMNVDSYTFQDGIFLVSGAAGGAGTININGDLAVTGQFDAIAIEAGKTVALNGGSISNTDGGILITGNLSGTYNAFSMGVDLNSGASISADAGSITIIGRGGDAPGNDWTIGVRVQGSTIQTASGLIDITGSGGDSDNFNPGVLVEWAGGEVTSTDGDIFIIGTGGAGSGTDNWGVAIADGGLVSATGSGLVSVTGTGGAGTSINYGVKITGTGTVSVDSGNLLIQGTVNAPSGQWNHGVNIDSGGQVLSDNGGTITINATGGAGTLENHGVRIADNGTLVESSTGNILINGLGGAGSQEGNRGIVIEGGADIVSTGAASVTLNGTGGVGAWGNHGIIIAGAGTTVTSSGGDIAIDGLGASAPGGWNNGVWIFAGANITATGAANIAVSGIGGNAGANGDNWGVMVENAGTQITSVNGNIALSGIGQGTTDQNNVGLYLRNDVVVGPTGGGGLYLSGSGGDSAAGIVVSGGSNVFGGPTMTGAITLTAHTESGADSIDLSSAIFQASGALVFQMLNADTSIGVAGGAGTFNLSSAELDLFQNGFSSITIGRSDGTGAVEVGAYTFNDPLRIQSNDVGGGGVITINGALATSTGNDGIELYAGRGVVVNAGITTNDGNITIRGNETLTVTGFSFGVDVNAATISAGTGNIDIMGKAGDDLGSSFGIGIRLTTGARIETTSGDITLDGIGNPSGDSFNWGVLMEWASTTVQSSSGDISITGLGGGTGNENNGVLIQGTSQVSNNTGGITILGTGSATGNANNYGVRVDFSDIASNHGDIDLTGQGGGTGNDNYGVFLQNGATITSSGNAVIDVTGTGADGTFWNVGTYIINAGTRISTASGNINVTGTAGDGNSSENIGLLVAGGAVIESGGSAHVNLHGFGGAGTWGNHGVSILDPGTEVTTVDGHIHIIGVGGSDGTDNLNAGVRVQNGPIIESTGSGDVNITGTGANGGVDNWGVWINSAMVQTVGSDINITGTGGNGFANNNYGMYLEAGALVESIGAGDVTLTGTGGDGTFGNHGVYLFNAGTEVCVEDGDLLIMGNGGNGSGGFNVGVNIDDFAAVEACNNGTVTIQGIGGGGSDDNWGIWMHGAFISSITGDIILTGLGGGTGADNYGIHMELNSDIMSFDTANIILDGRGVGDAEGIRSPNLSNTIGNVAMTGDITLIATNDSVGADCIDISGVTLDTNASVVLRPLQAATTIGVGNGTGGKFNISQAEIDNIINPAANVIIGRSNGTGAVDIFDATFNNQVSIYGGATSVGLIDVGANDLLVNAKGKLTHIAPVTGHDVTFVTNKSYINLEGVLPFDVTGRFLIYSVKPSQNQLLNLTYDFEKYGVTYPTGPGHAGNGLLYSDIHGHPLIQWALNTLLPQFVDTDDSSQHSATDHQHFPIFYPGEPSISYGAFAAGGSTIPSFQDALLHFSSFQLSGPKKVEDEEGL